MARRQSVLSDNADTARAQILAAADATVERFGVAKTTIDDVARETGVSRPTIYRYFRDRDTLMTALIETRSRRLFADTHAYVADRESFAEQVVDGLLYLVDRGRLDAAIRLLVSTEHADRSSGLDGSSELAARLTYEMWSPLLQKARARGEIRDGITDSEICKWITLVELILAGLMDFGDPQGESNRRLVARLLLPGIMTETPEVVR